MNCVDCDRFSNIDTGGHELNKYNCEHCLVDDYMTGEIQMQGEWEEFIFILLSISWILTGVI